MWDQNWTFLYAGWMASITKGNIRSRMVMLLTLEVCKWTSGTPTEKKAAYKVWHVCIVNKHEEVGEELKVDILVEDFLLLNVNAAVPLMLLMLLMFYWIDYINIDRSLGCADVCIWIVRSLFERNLLWNIVVTDFSTWNFTILVSLTGVGPCHVPYQRVGFSD